MRIQRDIPVPSNLRGASVALGNFDGVHLGHQAILKAARAASDAPMGVLTFEPHPRRVFAPDAPPFRLMNADARASRLEKLGCDVLFELPFGPDLSELSPEDFARRILLDGLGVSHVTVGQDFRFGKGRTGDKDTLSALGAAHGFGVTIAPLIETGGVTVSSSRIRAALAEGRPDVAAAMLGHWHRIEGPVIKGDQRGRDLGYPTANMALGDLHLPRMGIYAVHVDILDGPHAGSHIGVASLGTRPTFGVNTPNLETFVFDFSGDLYGAQLSVALVAFLRGEEKFADIDALIEQMDKDSQQARALLAT